MKIHMYEALPNFGDMLNKYIWPRYFRRHLEREDDLLMFGIGTLIGEKVAHPGRIVVCGSGCGYSETVDDDIRRRSRFFFVRGPLSARALGLGGDAAITDPAILTPDFFPAASHTGRVAFVPHWETSRNPLWRRACGLAGIQYIDPLADIAEVMKGLSGAKLVLAEAMHGAIVADSYRVPWVPVSTSARFNQFKWRDWAGSLGLAPAFHPLDPLGASDAFRNMTGKGRSMAVEAQKRERDAKDMARAVYKRLVPHFIRYRKDRFLIWTAGPALDAAGGMLGLRRAQLGRAAGQLQALAALPGMLSDERVAAGKRAMLEERLDEIDRLLDGDPALAA
jgi:succinoglycan biosynthesis protein ExoV